MTATPKDLFKHLVRKNIHIIEHKKFGDFNYLVFYKVPESMFEGLSPDVAKAAKKAIFTDRYKVEFNADVKNLLGWPERKRKTPKGMLFLGYAQVTFARVKHLSLQRYDRLIARIKRDGLESRDLIAYLTFFYPLATVSKKQRSRGVGGYVLDHLLGLMESRDVKCVYSLTNPFSAMLLASRKFEEVQPRLFYKKL